MQDIQLQNNRSELSRRVMRRVYLIWVARKYGIRILPLVSFMAVIAYFLMEFVFWSDAISNMKATGSFVHMGRYLVQSFTGTSTIVRALLCGGLVAGLLVIHDIFAIIRSTRETTHETM